MVLLFIFFISYIIIIVKNEGKYNMKLDSEQVVELLKDIYLSWFDSFNK